MKKVVNRLCLTADHPCGAETIINKPLAGLVTEEMCKQCRYMELSNFYLIKTSYYNNPLIETTLLAETYKMSIKGLPYSYSLHLSPCHFKL